MARMHPEDVEDWKAPALAKGPSFDFYGRRPGRIRILSAGMSRPSGEPIWPAGPGSQGLVDLSD